MASTIKRWNGSAWVTIIDGDNIDATKLTGTIASARLSGAYTGITSVGTLTGLTVSSSTAENLKSVGAGAGFTFESRQGSASGHNTLYRVNNDAYLWNSTTGTNVMSVSSAGVVGCFGAVVNNGNLTFNTSNGINWSAFGGSIWMQDTSWVRTDKGFWNAANTIGNDGYLTIGYGGVTDATWKVRFNYNTLVSQAFYAGSVQSAGLIHTTKETTATGTGSDWTTMGIRAQSQAAGSFNSAGYVAWVPGFAPQMRVYQQSGELWNFLNNPNTGFVPLWASAFTVQSTLRSKKDITTITDEEILTRLAETPRVVRYRYKVGPQTLVPDERFADVDARWQASGHAPLKPQPHHLGSQDHDCVAMNCAGNADNPCPITVNSEPDVGVIAEEWDDVWPELVWVDGEGEVGGFDYSRLGPVAMRAAAILLSRVEELTARVAALETES